jgi:hypothetical protein
VEIKEFSKTKEATDVKVLDQNNVACFFDIGGIIIHFEFVPKGTTVILCEGAESGSFSF